MVKAEIIAVGTELLLGQIVNTNAQYIAQECAGLGIGVYFQTVVGDNESRLREAYSIARKRADLIICTGGLGPTQDDITKDVLAADLGLELVLEPFSMDKIRSFYQARGIPMVESNARQALVFAGSEPLPNDTGMAVGVALTSEDGIRYILLPGPPREMKPMFERYAKPWLQAQMGEVTPLYSKMLKFAGIGESSLEHELLDLIKEQSDPTVAPYAKEAEVSLRLTTRASAWEQAEMKLNRTSSEIRSRVGQFLYAEEDVPIEHTVVKLLEELGATVSFAESCTGGLLSDLVTSIPGSSNVLRGGVVCYSNAVKHAVLNVPKHILEGEGAPGAISSETAVILAEEARCLMETDFALSVTGVAGPTESEGKPVGLVYVGLAHKGRHTEAYRLHLTGDRAMIKLKAAKDALYRLWSRLKEAKLL